MKMRNRMGRLGSVIVLSAWVVMSGGGVATADTNAPAPPKPGDPAPPLVMLDLAGEYVVISDLCYPGAENPKKPRSTVVLSFAGTDCEPCKRELPIFLKVAGEFKDKGVKFYVVMADPLSKQEAVKAFVQEYRIDCGVLLDPYKVVRDRLGITGIPALTVLTPEGTVSAVLQGAREDYEKELRQAIGQTRAK